MVLKSPVCLLCAGLRILHFKTLLCAGLWILRFKTFRCAKLFNVGSTSLFLVVIKDECVVE